jgi:hypothetical protein
LIVAHGAFAEGGGKQASQDQKISVDERSKSVCSEPIYFHEVWHQLCHAICTGTPEFNRSFT